MTWKLFLDDMRNPDYLVGKINFPWTEFHVVRSVAEAKKLIEDKESCPSFIAFDHDLSEEHYVGETMRIEPKDEFDNSLIVVVKDYSGHAAFQNNAETGYDFAKWLVFRDLQDRGDFLPKDFDFIVHSMNPVGAKNIREYLNSYIEFKNGK
jgi:hypothetical protein